ncbi:MAG: hypothetical protein P8J79_13260 [Halioglobus sp.]|nr:hypothetical protein [Halioglobus sp.]
MSIIILIVTIHDWSSDLAAIGGALNQSIAVYGKICVIDGFQPNQCSLVLQVPCRITVALDLVKGRETPSRRERFHMFFYLGDRNALSTGIGIA